MPSYEVITTFVDRDLGRRCEPGEVLDMAQDRGVRLTRRRLVRPVRERTIETATRHPAEHAAERVAAPRHIGGGWYELPSGERVQGQAAAWERMDT